MLKEHTSLCLAIASAMTMMICMNMPTMQQRGRYWQEGPRVVMGNLPRFGQYNTGQFLAEVLMTWSAICFLWAVVPKKRRPPEQAPE